MGDSDVVHADCVAGARLGAGADDVIDDDELGGRFAAGEVDLWFLLAHDASCGVVGGSRPEPQPWAERMSMTKMRVASPGMDGWLPCSPSPLSAGTMRTIWLPTFCPTRPPFQPSMT